MDDELVSAAHHEAGHIVIAHALDSRVISLKLFWSDLGRWFGESPVRLGKEDPQGMEFIVRMPQLLTVSAKTALAGMLAQAKYEGIRKYGEGIQFDLDADLNALSEFLRDNSRTEANPGSIEFGFTTKSGDRVTLRLSGHCFSTADSKSFNRSLRQVAGLDPFALTRETMQLIDLEANRINIKALATLVLKQPESGDDKLRSLTAEQILEVLSGKVEQADFEMPNSND
ncbi:hypothetical protein FYK55_27285 [Roseiconus nitratireducens]|uniref:Peptidase M41 domain-containing protein n=1 Tax=Roseiconus nitratireducens TaxID=2605748 RepID=A0A5M6CU69_9BACT|nr:hypothetical protein [Roseiconus nitratireducens]KAA5538593.1 hypothetical protein FYK55_27285 [Roseiconus nitratireducens]